VHWLHLYQTLVVNECAINSGIESSVESTRELLK